MEGPSLVIATLELRPFRKKRIQDVSGSTKKINIESLRGQTLNDVKSYGKHLLLFIGSHILRIHFLMFGSYRINDEKADRTARLHCKFSNGDIYFYSCSIRELTPEEFAEYDWGRDVMSEVWNPELAMQSLGKHKNAMVCDVLMDQNIFAGVGNIIKNEILFRLKIHPEKKIKELTKAQQKSLIEQAQIYSEEFFEWKVLYILKRNWKIMRKKSCPDCQSQVIRKKTGKLMRWSYFCPQCQGIDSQYKLPLVKTASQ